MDRPGIKDAEVRVGAHPPRLRPTASADGVPLPAWLIAAALVALELAVSGRYGFMQDELYFIEAGRHLAFGYVDQPPLAPLLTRIVTSVLGVSPTAVRIIPALAGGAVVVIAARCAALFGAGRFGRVLAALTTACAPVIFTSVHVDNTTPLDLLFWAAVVLCVATALLRGRPRWWLGAGVLGGLGLENDNLMLLLLGGIAIGVLVSSAHRQVLRTRWPWFGAVIAAVIWAPNLVWEAANGWPQLAMAAALRSENNSAGDYAAALPVQLAYVGLLVAPVVIAGFVRLWRTADLRFIAVAATLVLVYVVAWIPGKGYYADGMAPAVLAAGSAAAEQWIARGRRPRARTALLIAASLIGLVLLPDALPVVPVTAVHTLSATAQQSSDLGDTIGWPQLTRAVAGQDAALARAGHPPTAIFTGYYGEAAALGVLGAGYHLPPVLSGHNAYWMWGPGRAADTTVLVVDALGRLRPYFASCRLLTTYHGPYHVQNNWTPLQIGVCTGPVAGWPQLWPQLKHYG
jgi:4-amino-4-deoxy-L-arabinose transferase-like glycosyltransferase